MTRVIWWLRRDLRLTDNLTLHQALREAAHAAGIEMGKDYPPPVVDHAQARARALARYRQRS